MLLIITTIPHIVSIYPLVNKINKPYIYEYINIIILSAIYSILFHIYEEKNIIINDIDYFLAGMWFFYDCILSFIYTDNNIQLKIILTNSISFLINTQIDNNNYIIEHSLWHIINFTKCYYVSQKLSSSIYDIRLNELENKI